VLSGNLHPHYAESTHTLAKYMDIETHSNSALPGGLDDIIGSITDDTAAVVVQNPDVFGQAHDLTPIAEAAHAKGALLIAVFTEAVSMGLMKTPGAMGADIVVGEGQSIGVGLQFGGPYVGLFACRNDRNYIRNMPGRLAGETVDADGRRGFVLTLSTREQHIRRDKATSNICTNSGLMALAWTIHMSLLGDSGLKTMAQLSHERACQLADRLSALEGVELVTDTFFNEFTLRLPKPAADVILVAATETNCESDIAAYEAALKEVL